MENNLDNKIYSQDEKLNQIQKESSAFKVFLFGSLGLALGISLGGYMYSAWGYKEEVPIIFGSVFTILGCLLGYSFKTKIEIRKKWFKIIINVFKVLLVLTVLWIAIGFLLLGGINIKI